MKLRLKRSSTKWYGKEKIDIARKWNVEPNVEMKKLLVPTNVRRTEVEPNVKSLLWNTPARPGPARLPTLTVVINCEASVN
ncbi:hypothetical protein J6590_020096 [Homalodisca vitripennis]|nr:hypothetical protein J6590_020096 [Homalodisca vitripennis]